MRAICRGSQGFTLIELLVVLAILSLATLLALPSLKRPPDGLRLELAARNLASALRLSRATAIARHTEIALFVDAEQRNFHSPVVSRTHLDIDIVMSLVVAAPERAGKSSGGFRFFPNGSSTGGHIDLALGNRRVRVLVSWLTGEVHHQFMGSTAS